MGNENLAKPRKKRVGATRSLGELKQVKLKILRPKESIQSDKASTRCQRIKRMVEILQKLGRDSKAQGVLLLKIPNKCEPTFYRYTVGTAGLKAVTSEAGQEMFTIFKEAPAEYSDAETEINSAEVDSNTTVQFSDNSDYEPEHCSNVQPLASETDGNAPVQVAGSSNESCLNDDCELRLQFDESDSESGFVGSAVDTNSPILLSEKNGKIKAQPSNPEPEHCSGVEPLASEADEPKPSKPNRSVANVDPIEPLSTYSSARLASAKLKPAKKINHLKKPTKHLKRKICNAMLDQNV